VSSNRYDAPSRASKVTVHDSLDVLAAFEANSFNRGMFSSLTCPESDGS